MQILIAICVVLLIILIPFTIYFGIELYKTCKHRPITCSDGYGLSNGQCDICDYDTYSSNNICIECPQNTYSNKGSGSCILGINKTIVPNSIV